MRVVETVLDAERYEQRYSMPLGGLVTERFVRRPVAIVPPEGTVGFVDDGPRLGTLTRLVGAAYRGGQWRGVKFEPTHWTILDAG